MRQPRSHQTIKRLIITGTLLVLAVAIIIHRHFNPDLPATTRLDLSPPSTVALNPPHPIAPELTTALNTERLRALLPQTLPQDYLPINNHRPLTLWQVVPQKNPTNSPPALTMTAVITDPAVLKKLAAGRQIEFVTPNNQQTLSAEITAQQLTHKGINIFDLKLDGGDSLTGGQIASGKTSTDIALITGQGSYTVSINNQTGAGQMIDNKNLHIYKQHSDAVLVPTEAPAKPEPSP
jgi:hypothetical protein